MIDKAGAAHGRNRWAVVSAGPRRKPEDAHHRNHPAPEPPEGGCDGGDGGHVSGEVGTASDDFFDPPDLDAIFH